MAISIHGAAYSMVAVVGAILFAVGTPAERASETPVVVTAAAHAEAASTASSGGVTLHSVTVEFPSSGRSFPGGAAAEGITDNCTACHSPGMVLNQPAQKSST